MIVPKPKVGDFVIIALVLLSGTLPWLTRSPHRAESFSIYVNGKKIAQIPAERDTVFSVNGALGKVVLEVKGGRIRVVRSNCPEKICIKTGYISSAGQSIACVPNKLIVVAEGKQSQGKYDAILH